MRRLVFYTWYCFDRQIFFIPIIVYIFFSKRNFVFIHLTIHSTKKKKTIYKVLIDQYNIMVTIYKNFKKFF